MSSSMMILYIWWYYNDGNGIAAKRGVKSMKKKHTVKEEYKIIYNKKVRTAHVT